MLAVSTSKKIVKGIGISIIILFVILFVMFAIGMETSGDASHRSKEDDNKLSAYIGGMIACIFAGFGFFLLYQKLESKQVHFGSRVVVP